MVDAVRFESVSRHFDTVAAVDGINLTIREGEFFALLGPSGSGKTTCLRLISGIDRPTDGHIEIFGVRSDDIPPNRRPVNTVFQDYALFPHLNVIENVSYGLRVKGVSRPQRYKEADALLELVKLGGYGQRSPAQLSGGQRQRVALARALINKPRVLLLDEPLGALDLKLREQMQEELKVLQKSIGITFVFVTHDQNEALSMSDRIAIVNEGRIIQVGTPHEIYQRPRTRFVAEFVGSSNVLSPQVSVACGGDSQWSSLRPESIRIVEPGEGRIDGVLETIRFMGSANFVTVSVKAGKITAQIDAAVALPPIEAAVSLTWDSDAMHVMESDD
ncbi:MAG: ABC transporter ATP-binding protein [Acidiferrobacterales bacterium]|nr:ABC transporter ATP-binding protein [Acidiferrobacterales bacterium]